MTWSFAALRPPSRRLWWLLIAIVTALTLYLRLYHLGWMPFWFDEVFSLNVVELPYSGLWGVWFDIHPPLFYVPLKLWLGIVGHDEYLLRLLAFCFSVATLPAVILIGRRLGGPWVALAAALCYAVAPTSIAYAQELRMYSLLGCLGAWTLYGFVRLATDPQRAAIRFWRRDADRPGWALLIGGTVLALYTHNLGFLLPFTTTVLALGLWLGRPERRQLALNWALSQALVLLLWAPYAPRLLYQMGRVSGFSWIGLPGWRGVLRTELSVAYGLTRFDELLTWLSGLGFVLLTALGAWALARPWGRMLLAAFALPAIGALLISVGFRPVYLGRPLIWSEVPVAVLLGAGAVAAVSLRHRLLVPAVVFLVALSAANSVRLWSQLNTHRDDWRDVARGIAAEAKPDDLVIVHTMGGRPIAYYLERLHERTGVAVPAVLSLDPGPTKTVRQLLHAPTPERFLLVVTPWHNEQDFQMTLLHLRYPCHQATGHVLRSGMELWRYERQPGCSD